MVNPFKFGLEVSGKQFYDRTEVGEKLYRRLSGGSSNVVMYAPRRYGKTSLVKKVLGRFQAEKVPTVYFDLNRIENLERFCEDYASALCSLLGKTAGFAERLKNDLSHLHPSFSFGGDLPISVKFDYGERMTSVSLSAVLDLAETVANDLEVPSLVVAFDEFQEIGRLSPDLPLEGIFRGCIQAHKRVRYIFFGSKTHLLTRMFADKSRPFYKSASTIRLEKPPREESRAFVKSRFAAASILVDDEAAERIVAASENIPYYLQQLSSLAYESVCATGRDYLAVEDIVRAEQDLIDENADYYAERLSSLSATQRLLVSALSREPIGSFREEYRRRHMLGGSSTVNSALKVIREAGLVESDDASYFIGDPFFAKFVRGTAVKIGPSGFSRRTSCC